MVKKKKRSGPRVDVNELNKIADASTERALSQEESEKLKSAIRLLAAEQEAEQRTSEKIKDVFGSKPAPEEASKEPRPKAPGHGRNGHEVFTAGVHIKVPHANLKSGCACPSCEKGKVYDQKPKIQVRVIGQAPLHANIYGMERFRCNLCGQTFAADSPPGLCDDKYEASAVAMVAALKYGSGMPFSRIESMQESLGVPLPASTQWDLMEDAAEELKPVFQKLCELAAQGEQLHIDDTSMKILSVPRMESDTRTGLFTTGVVSVHPARRIGLYFTGTHHAGENIHELLKLRNSEIKAPTLMCDALSRNVPKGNPEQFELGNCLAHGRRHFVDVADNFPAECLHVLDALGTVYRNDRYARDEGLDPKARLRHHQAHSEPVLKELHKWLGAKLDNNEVEPNSGLGKAMKYLLRHWKPLTLFLRQAGAPLDNNVCERALKMTVLHRKNALFYRTLNGAQVGDLFMSLIQTCLLNDVNPFHYLTVILRNSDELHSCRTDWLPWTYRETLARGAPA